MSSSINVEPLGGFRDFGVKETANRLWMIEQARAVFEQFGYPPIETPSMEREEVLRGQYGDEGDTLRFKIVRPNKEVQQFGTIYDLTVPFARFVAANLPKGKIGLPFRRSQVQRVWRGEKPQQGRYREFYQADFDIAGSSNPSADVETVLIGGALMAKFGLDCRVRINNRGLLDAILRSCGVIDDPETFKAALQIVDGLEKKGSETVKEFLQSRIDLDEGQAEDVLTMLTTPFDESTLRKRLDSRGQEPLDNLVAILELARSASPKPEQIIVDLSVARGLSYYNAFVIEVNIVGAEDLGTVVGGGRYDNTIGTFLDRQIPAVGASLGVDRCYDALDRFGIFPESTGLADVAVLAFNEYRDRAFVVAQDFRAKGCSAITIPDPKPLRDLLGYGQSVARTAVIIGKDEVESGQLSFKDFGTGSQMRLSFDEIVAELKG